MGNLALTYHDRGRFDKAEKLEVQVMDMFKEKLGADHPNTLASMHNLAYTWKAQGRGEEASNEDVRVSAGGGGAEGPLPGNTEDEDDSDSGGDDGHDEETAPIDHHNHEQQQPESRAWAGSRRPPPPPQLMLR
ncbi:hypothetical protein DL766_006150 [Monosporascus sp. MC13-8B]|nr:hypothetical protein DL763_000742 [Monosporascus cannonballus]RYP27906.1 hypothetical protein DL766_006150 [Monosporascus sp. MC13-8B]